jgi:hypothetical protein
MECAPRGAEWPDDGKIVKVRVDTVVLPDGSKTDREVVEHTGSVAVVAVDGRQWVLLIRTAILVPAWNEALVVGAS